MLDIKRIKEDPNGVKAGLKAKEVDCDDIVDRILELDKERRRDRQRTAQAEGAHAEQDTQDNTFDTGHQATS